MSPEMSMIHPSLLRDKKSFCSIKLSGINHCSHTGEHLLCTKIMHCLPNRKRRRNKDREKQHQDKEMVQNIATDGSKGERKELKTWGGWEREKKYGWNKALKY